MLIVGILDLSFIGIEASRREGIMKKIYAKIKLSPKENSAVIHSINFSIKTQIGNRRPNPALCRLVIWFFILHFISLFVKTS